MLPSRLVDTSALRVVEPPVDVPGCEMAMLWHERSHREVADAVVQVVGPQRVGVRLALSTLQGAVDDTPEATYLATAKVLDEVGIAYIHIAEADWDDALVMPAAFKGALRLNFSGTMICSGHYTKKKAMEAIERVGPTW